MTAVELGDGGATQRESSAPERSAWSVAPRRTAEEGPVLAGRAALVTGASRGIGLATARALVGAGARVAMLARGAAALSASADALGASALAVPCDVTDAASVSRSLGIVHERWGGLPDILVSNAGLFAPRPIPALTPAQMAAALELNLLAPFRLLHALLPSMRERQRGHVVTIGSVADRTIFPENAAYSASKFGARALHEVLRAELRGSGVRATLVSPGPTDTSIWDDVLREGEGRFPPRSAMLAPDDVAAAVLFALSRPADVNVDELRLTRT